MSLSWCFVENQGGGMEGVGSGEAWIGVPTLALPLTL